MRWTFSYFRPRPTQGTYFAFTRYTQYDRLEHTHTHMSINTGLREPCRVGLVNAAGEGHNFFFNYTLSAEKNKQYVPFCWCRRWCCPFWPRTAGGRQKTSKRTDRKPETDEKRVENERVQHGLTTLVYCTRVNGGRATDADVDVVARTVFNERRHWVITVSYNHTTNAVETGLQRRQWSIEPRYWATARVYIKLKRNRKEKNGN